MKLTILGKYGPFPKVNGATSGYLLQTENQNIVLDLGSGTLARLKEVVEVKNLSFLILSHLHFDHVSDMGILSYALSFLGRKDKLNVYLPNFSSSVLDLLKGIKEFNLIYIEEGKTYRENDVEFSFYKMTHPVLSYGVKITDGKSTFSYTGDTTFNDNIKNLVSGADFALCDGAFLERDYLESKPHMSVKQASMITKLFGGKVIVTHIGEGYEDIEVEKEIKSITSRAEIAKEGKTYQV